MRRPPRAASLLLLAALAVAGSACGDDEPTADAEPGEVLVVDNEFEPEDVEVAVGDTVTWRFEGSARHNVTPTGDGREDWEASPTKKDGTFEQTFENAGTYDYVCTLHPGMTGTVTVA
jgi:plastocyanin